MGFILNNQKVLFTIILGIAGIVILLFIRNRISKKVTKDLKEEYLANAKVSINFLTLAYLGYFLGLLLLFLGKMDIGLAIAGIGITIAIYYTQSLESYKTIQLIEKKLSSKIEKINVTNLQKTIAEEVSKTIIDEINIDELKNEIKNELIKNLKEK